MLQKDLIAVNLLIYVRSAYSYLTHCSSIPVIYVRALAVASTYHLIGPHCKLDTASGLQLCRSTNERAPISLMVH